MEENNPNSNPEENNKNKKTVKINSYWIYGAVIMLLILGQLLLFPAGSNSKISFDQLKAYTEAGDIKKVNVVNESIAEIYLKKESLNKYPNAVKTTFSESQPNFTMEIGSLTNFETKFDKINDSLTQEQRVEVTYERKTNVIGTILSWLLMPLIFIGLYFFLMRRVSGGAGGPGAQIFNIGKSKAQLFEKDSKVNLTFADVAGLDEAKEEIMEIVDFLKNPKKYTSLGGKIPKGVLLVGPPGTGKTLLAKAVAGEANVPFFSMSGSDFVEMFVGVGASRVRDLFKQAREKAPCIVFIDEIDAIGRSRGRNNFQGGNDERENTLNQLLVEMDGFSTDKGVIIMAATNRADVLDNALMRPGRFDRQIGIDRPDMNGRVQIFNVHLRGIKLNPEVSSVALAEMTPGFAGADIANVCNEAALIAARRNKSSVDMSDFNYALDRVIGGLEKKNSLISPREKEIISYHEAGHAVCGWFLEHASPLVKVTIVPRGIGTLGYAQYLPKEEYITRTEQLLDRICMTFGGRAAEEIVFGKISTGAQNDLDQVTKLAYSMITIYGMNKNVGNVSFYQMGSDSFQKPFSEHTASMIDEEVRKLLEEQYKRCVSLLKAKRQELEILAQELLDKEVLQKADVERLLGPRPYKDEAELLHPELKKDPKPLEGNNPITVSA
ncbi:MAG TPA: ATP-dependent zinc metalloprotease FtsH [Saprospiraceae bacterium]|nr:MAG: ATP-dependent metalloprotease FtsH [Candidatus Parvibacillus calidus]MBX2935832.1 ATP-dependent zinc metalloprotease FtsH [Saprospiraceae bacterium]MBX7178395.1 ATP-dependent zinc metalloprotease FtsH [Saprospiraceae bacterium]MCB0591415.1 ATP-dependent zinc metalloprotease FtsH [Saprospiraceae bacterium]MCC7148085.1 ATP-dependent zinc metalloprotease FtsH [Saprospiraceae bacterium]